MTPTRSAIAAFLVFTALLLVPATPALAGELTIDLGRGPVTVFIPSSYDPDVSAPLLLLLHGYGSNGAEQEAYMRFKPVVEERGIIYAHPDGMSDIFGLQFWNGTDACCDLFGTNVDDSSYLLNLINEIKSQLNVDDKRVFLTGHSNGGFMSYRMGCDHADVIAAFASLAGATWEDPANCEPTEPVHQLQIHGTDDETILFDGTCNFFQCYPGALGSTAQWAGFNGCERIADRSNPPRDLDFLLPGAETVSALVTEGCSTGGSAAIWVIRDGSHVPALNSSYAVEVVDYLMAHPKP